MDFVRSPFGKMQLWIVEHFHLHKKVPVLMNHNIWKKSYVKIHYYRYLFVKMKVFYYSELHFSEVTYYKIPTLASALKSCIEKRKKSGGGRDFFSSFSLFYRLLWNPNLSVRGWVGTSIRLLNCDIHLVPI